MDRYGKCGKIFWLSHGLSSQDSQDLVCQLWAVALGLQDFRTSVDPAETQQKCPGPSSHRASNLARNCLWLRISLYQSQGHTAFKWDPKSVSSDRENIYPVHPSSVFLWVPGDIVVFLDAKIRIVMLQCQFSSFIPAWQDMRVLPYNAGMSEFVGLTILLVVSAKM